jgi:hypothetical protein
MCHHAIHAGILLGVIPWDLITFSTLLFTIAVLLFVNTAAVLTWSLLVMPVELNLFVP